MIKRLLVLGGGSDIAVALVSRLANATDAASPLTSVVLAGRAGGSLDQASETLRAKHPALTIATVDFDGADSGSHGATLEQFNDTHGPFDTVVVAFGQLGDPFTIDADPGDMAALAHLNFGGAVSSCLASIAILRGEPGARLVVFSSIAAVRPRVGNIVYGSAKSGLDAFAREISAPAKQVGVDVVIVRPGFVHSRMTQGLEPAPFATTPDEVANDIVDGLEKGRSIIHSPAVLAPVGLVLKNLPGFVWRQISQR